MQLAFWLRCETEVEGWGLRHSMSCRWDLNCCKWGETRFLCLFFCYVQGSIYTSENIKQTNEHRNSPPTSLMSWNVHTKSNTCLMILQPHSNSKWPMQKLGRNGFMTHPCRLWHANRPVSVEMHSGFKVVTWSWVLATTRRWQGDPVQ